MLSKKADIKRDIIIFLLLVLFFICIFTWPLAVKINSAIPGFENTNEPQATIWYYWWQKYAWYNKLSDRQECLWVGFPFGFDFKKGGGFYPLWTFITKWLSIFSTPIFTYNIQVLLSFILSALFMYYLMFFLGRDKMCSFFAGVIYSFLPYHFARVWQHLGLSQIQWMPLFLFSVFKLKERQNIKNILFCTVSFLLVGAFDYYYTYFMAIVISAFICYLILFELMRTKKFPFRPIGFLIIALFLSFVVLSPVIFSIANKMLFSSTTAELIQYGYRRSFGDLFTQSAKPLSYLLPATTHPVFGKFSERFIGSPLYGVSYTEHTLYLGWLPIILAFVAFRRWRKARKLKIKNEKLKIDERENFYIGVFVLLAIVAWLFSQPPYFTFPYFKIYMPSFFMYKILPMFRAYFRFGIVVMLAISVLAGFGLKFILERFKTKRARLAFASLVCGLVLFEFLNFPPFKVIDLTKYPKVYDWLKEQKGDFVIAEYPLDTKSPNEYYKFCQTIHEKKIINGTIPGTYANQVAKAIWKLSDPKTAGMLSWMKVKYVLLHLTPYGESNEAEVLDELGKIQIKRLPGLKPLRSFDDVDVYEVIAEPKELDINE